MSRAVKRPCAAAAATAAVFLAGVFVGRGPLPPPPAGSAGEPPAAPAPPVVASAPAPLFDFHSPDAGAVLDAVLADWFTAPGRRERALSLLVDPMAGPFDGSRPPLRRVVVEARRVPGWYRPNVLGLPAVVQNLLDREPLEAGELVFWVDRFAVLPDGGAVVEVILGNHGYAHFEAVYTVRKGPSGWVARVGEQ